MVTEMFFSGSSLDTVGILSATNTTNCDQNALDQNRKLLFKREGECPALTQDHPICIQSIYYKRSSLTNPCVLELTICFRYSSSYLKKVLSDNDKDILEIFAGPNDKYTAGSSFGVNFSRIGTIQVWNTGNDIVESSVTGSVHLQITPNVDTIYFALDLSTQAGIVYESVSFPDLAQYCTDERPKEVYLRSQSHDCDSCTITIGNIGTLGGWNITMLDAYGKRSVAQGNTALPL